MNIEKIKAELENLQERCNPIISFVDTQKRLAELDNNNYDQNNFFYRRVIAVKDNISVAKERLTGASLMLDNYIAPYNATVVDKLLKAGAIIIAKTSLDELAMGGSNRSSYYGPVLNPFDPKRISGGSSGGSAVVVASEIIDFALASDTGDSIRKPAAYCGIVGVKPTYGRISRYGVIPYASSLDHVGYFCLDVKSAAAALTVLAGRDDKDMTSLKAPVIDYAAKLNPEVQGKKIAVLSNVIDNISNPDIKNAFNEVIKKLKDQGAVVEEVTVDNDLMRALLPTYMIIANSEASSNQANLDGLRFGLQEDGDFTAEVMIKSRSLGFGIEVKRRLLLGAYCLEADNQKRLFRKAQKVRRLIYNHFSAVFSKYEALIAPACGSVAPLLNDTVNDELQDEYLIAENYMVYANFIGFPSMSIPMAKQEDLPLGINITTRKLAEQDLFDIGLAIEEACAFKRRKDKQ